MARKNKRKLNKDRIGYVLITLSIVVVCVAVFVYFEIQKTHVPLDKVTFCPKDGAHSYTVVLLDTTDSFNTIQQAAIKKKLDEIKFLIPRYGSIELYAVRNTDKALLAPEIKICNPGRKEDIDPMTGNPEIVHRMWVNRFSSKLDIIFDRILNMEKANESPIMQSIQSLNISAFTVNSNINFPKKMIIVSDMLQHTAEYSHYSKNIKFESFKNSELFKKVRTNLRDTSIEVLYVRRNVGNSIQGVNHVQFWNDYFSFQNGTLERVIGIEG